MERYYDLVMANELKRYARESGLPWVAPEGASEEERWEVAKRELSGSRLGVITEWGFIDFDPAGLKDLVGGEGMSYEDHVWMECDGFEGYQVGTNLSFTAEIYRYVKTGNGKMLDFGLRNPQGIRKIGGYDLLSDEELELQAADEFICRELCLYKEHCYGTACLADADWRKTMRKELSGLENRKESRGHVGRHREMKVRYIGPNQGDAFINNKVYEVIDVQVPWLRIIDDSEEDYIYLINEPRLLDSSVSGKFEIVEDDEKGTLHQAFEELRKLIADYNSSSAGRKSPLKQVGE